MSGGEGQRKTEGGFQAGFTLSAESDSGLIPTAPGT